MRNLDKYKYSSSYSYNSQLRSDLHNTAQNMCFYLHPFSVHFTACASYFLNVWESTGEIMLSRRREEACQLDILDRPSWGRELTSETIPISVANP